MDLNRVLEKEVDLIQSCINRMSQHSFYLKGWAITLIGGLIALKPENIVVTGILMMGIVIAFWYLNAKYLRYEKQYRRLYEWVIEERPKGNIEHLYRLDITDFKDEVEKTRELMFKNTLRAFYLPLSIVVIIFIIFMSKGNNNESVITIIFH